MKLTLVTAQEEGFGGEIVLRMENLPPGVEALPGTELEPEKGINPDEGPKERFVPKSQKATVLLVGPRRRPGHAHAPDDPDRGTPRARGIAGTPPVRAGSPLDVVKASGTGPGRRQGERKSLRQSSLMTLILSAWVILSQAQAAVLPGKPAASHKSPLSIRLVPQDVRLWGSQAAQRFPGPGEIRRRSGTGPDLTGPFFRFPIRMWRAWRQPDEYRPSPTGRPRLRVEATGRTVHATIRVEGSGETRPFSFGRVIGGILTQKGCNDSGCHGSVKGRGGED